MNVTTAIDGASARITLCGDIDFDSLPPLRAAADALPAHVADLLWDLHHTPFDLHHTPFMDVAGLHILFAPSPGVPARRTTVTGLRQQPLRLLL